MDSKYRVISIIFCLEEARFPYHIVSDIEKYFGQGHNVILFKAFAGDVYMCSLMGESAVAEVKHFDSVFINKKFIDYKVFETNVISVKISIPYRDLMMDDLNRMLRLYGNILRSEIERTSSRSSEFRTYYAVLEQKRDIPPRLKSKLGYVNVVEIV